VKFSILGNSGAILYRPGQRTQMPNAKRDPQRYLAGMDDRGLVLRWRNLIRNVYDELLGLNQERQVMAEALCVMNANPRLLAHPIRSYFLDSVRRWYGLAMAIAVRRQLDPDRRSASLRVLLRELEVRSDAYRVETLRQFSPRATDDAIRTLGLAVKREDGWIDVEKVRADLALLDELDRQVGDYVDRHVAHTNFSPERNVDGPLYSDLEDSFRELERLTSRYYTLFYGGSYTLQVGMSHEWIDGFEFPWRIRESPVASETKAYLVRVDRIAEVADAEAIYGKATSADAYEARRREFMAELVRQASKLEPEKRIRDSLLPDAVSIERLK